MTKEVKILIAVAAVIILGGVGLFLFANPQPKEASKPLDEKSLVREASHKTGKVGAKVQLVEFADFQCPACGAAHPVVKSVLEQYKDNPEVSFIFRHFPLSSIHRNAQMAAEVAEAAGEQGKFWEMSDFLFGKQKEWESQSDPLPLFLGYAVQIGVQDMKKMEDSIKNKTFSEIVSADFRDGETLGVDSTPTFFLNGEKFTGVPKLDELKAKIDEKLK